MREHRHARFGLNPGNKRLAAARDDDVDLPLRRQHRADECAIGGRHQLDRVGGHPFGHQAFNHRGMKRAIGTDGFGPAAQDRGIARFQAQGACIRRHIGATFEDDANDAQRHAHSGKAQPVGANALIDDHADRVAQVRHGLHRRCNAF